MRRRSGLTVAGLFVLGLICALVAVGCDMAPQVDRGRPTATPVSQILPVPRGTSAPLAVSTSMAVGVPAGGAKQGTQEAQDTQGVSGGKQQPGATLAPDQYTDANGLPVPVPSTAANPIVWVDREAAWGADLPITQVPALVDADHVFKMTDVSADGKLLAGVLSPVSSTEHYLTGTLTLMNVANRQVSAPKPSGVPVSASAARLDGDWLVWWDEGADWRWDQTIISAYNLTSGQERRVEAGPLPRVQSLAQSVFDAFPRTPSVSGGTVVWAELVDSVPDPNKMASVVKSMDLATGEVKVLGTGGAAPITDGKHVSWIQPDLSTYTADGEFSSVIVVTDLHTGQTQSIDVGFWCRQLALDGDWLAYNGQPTVLENLSQTWRQVIVPEGGERVEYLAMNSRVVAIGSMLSVWDRLQNRLVRLGGYPMDPLALYGQTTAVKGNTLAWESAPGMYNAATPEAAILPSLQIYIVDTSQLPK